jgi:hypothetical protein
MSRRCDLASHNPNTRGRATWLRQQIGLFAASWCALPSLARRGLPQLPVTASADGGYCGA